MKLILTGVTGVGGLAIYRAALADPTITNITLLSRRTIPDWAQLPPNAATKTSLILHRDFLAYPPDLARQLAEHDACIWALGKSAIGMNEKDYTTLTYEYPTAFVRALRDAGVGERRTAGDPFRFVYLSGEQADTTGQARQMWARVKGRAENELTGLCDAATNMKAHIYRPGYFAPLPEDRKYQRSWSIGMLDRVMTPLMSTLTPSLVSPIQDLARFVVEVAKGRWPEKTLFRNADMLKLIKEVPKEPTSSVPAAREDL
ncbi:hypothetical protein A0H81_02626 [Grifola frondosa]|uniref:Nucleoside-diphosphate-sugar epimerase n=1 Tax=Grifola frondosa TaxID=5627 RepID=A0A1C7MMR6_GRIFR|nr:hypothetical protein A0H81_02626 [Grifola frondosa]